MTSIEKIVYRLNVIFFRVLGLLPLRWLRRVGRFAGRFFFLSNRKHRKLTIENLAHVFGSEKGPSEIRIMACQVFENLMQVPFEMAFIPKLQHEDVGQLIRVEGLQHLQRARQKGKGVLCLGAHIGNWEIIPSVCSFLGYSFDSVARPLDFKALDLFVTELRTWHGGSIIPKRSSMRMILKSLNQGSVVGIILDQNARWHEGVFTDYFGRPACTNKGLALLALKTKAPVIPVFLVRNGLHYKMWFDPEVALVRTGYKTKDIETNTQAYTRIIESVVRRYPTQWNWSYKRWKTKTCQPWPRD